MTTILALDLHDDVKHMQRVLGIDASPTGRLRLLRTKTAGRLQLEWAGEFGNCWCDVPAIDLDVLPPRTPAS